MCEPSSLLVGRNFETSTVPNLQFPNYDSACERSYYQVLRERALLPKEEENATCDVIKTEGMREGEKRGKEKI